MSSYYIIMITGIVGKPGEGKTLSMAAMAVNFAFKNKKVYSNFDLFLPKSKFPLSSLIISRQDLENATGGMVFLDEIGKWLDARESFSDDNAFATGVLQKGRKRGNNLIFSAQDFWMVDVRLRINTDYVFMPEIFYRIFPGEETKIKQNFFDPINVTPLIPCAFVRLYQVMASVYLREKYITPKDVVSIYEFPMYPFINYYNTREEIQDLSRSEVEKGMNIEHEHARLCEIHFKLNEPIKVNPDSGRGMDSLDFEFKLDGKLIMVDSTTPNLMNNNEYINLREKSPVNEFFYDTDKKRSAEKYLSFFHPKTSKQLYLLPIDEIKEVPNKVLRINDGLLSKCVKVETPVEPELRLDIQSDIVLPEPKQIEIPNTPSIEIIPKIEYKQRKLLVMQKYGL